MRCFYAETGQDEQHLISLYIKHDIFQKMYSITKLSLNLQAFHAKYICIVLILTLIMSNSKKISWNWIN